MTQAPTDALRLVPVEPTWDQLVAMRDCCAELSGIEADSETMLTALYRAALKAAPASPLPGSTLPADVVRLVIAARMVAFDRVSAATIAELDAASEAFASRVPWDNAPDELPAAPTGEPK